MYLLTTPMNLVWFFIKMQWYNFLLKTSKPLFHQFNYFFIYSNLFSYKNSPTVNLFVKHHQFNHNLNKKFPFTNALFTNIFNDLYKFNFKFSIFFKFIKKFNIIAIKQQLIVLKKNFFYIFDEGLIYLRGLFIVFFVDACITDDEPLWEPIEWSLIQTWIFFIFLFAWIAENLITSRYGAYTGRDKRVWFAWYKTFWLIEGWYIISFGAAILFVIVPFYYELTYNISFVFSWWHWYSRIFFFKFTSLYSIILLISTILILNLRWLNWKKLFILILIINCFLAYLLYVHFIMSFFGYFTDPIWYQKSRFIDYIQLSHEPLKWGWGPAKRDHFTYHKTSTVFWFKNDSPFASSFLLTHLFLFLTIFFLNIYWWVLLRRIYTTQELTYTYLIYCVSSLRQFFYFYLLLYVFIFISFMTAYWRYPIELLWLVNSYSWWETFFQIIGDYFSLIALIIV